VEQTASADLQTVEVDFPSQETDNPLQPDEAQSTSISGNTHEMRNELLKS
jgi:hypothetical protein